MSDVTVGSLIDHYKILEEIGKGGMGVVFKALNVNLDKEVAVKTIALGLSSDEIFLNRFRTEARALARLRDTNIVDIYDLRLDDNQWFIVMEYVEGITLAQKIREGGASPWKDTLTLFKQILSAIGHAHRVGIIHRDIKPNNVMITADGTVKVTDFGLAKDQQNKNHTIVSSTGGTLFYMSPEQLKGLQFTDFRSDIYALGLTLYEMLTGKIPFRKDDTDFTIREAIIRRQFPPPTHFIADIPLGLNNIVMRAIEKKPDARFQHVDDMFEAIQEFERDRGLTPLPDKEEEQTHDISSLPEPVHDISYINDPPLPETAPAAEIEKPEDIQRKPIFWKYAIAFILICIIGAVYIFYPEKPSGNPLMIVTQPEHAMVYIDNDSLGSSPIYLKGFSQGTYALSIRKNDYMPMDTIITIADDSIKYLAFNLTATGNIEFDIFPLDAKSYINDIHYDLSPGRKTNLPEGNYVLRLVHPDYQTYEEDIFIEKGENPLHSINMIRYAVSTENKLARVSIISEPSKSMVFHNEKYLGKTPYHHLEVLPGNYEITLRKQGFQDYHTKVAAILEETVTVNAALQPLLVKLYIESNPENAEIWIDDLYMKNLKTPIEIDNLPQGQHSIKLSKKGYRQYNSSIILEPDTNNKIFADLTASLGQLEIVVRPWGSIYIDGQLKKRDTNTKYTTRLTTGVHQIKVQHPLYGNWEKEVNVQEDYVTTLPIDFNDLVNIRVTAFDADGKPIWAQIVVDDKLIGELTPKEISVRVGQRTIAAKKDGYILVSGKRRLMLDKNLDEPIKFILKKVL